MTSTSSRFYYNYVMVWHGNALNLLLSCFFDELSQKSLHLQMGTRRLLHLYNQCVRSVLHRGGSTLQLREHDLGPHAETGPETTQNGTVHMRLPSVWRGASTSFHNFTQGFCICPWAIIDRVHASLCNTRSGDLTASETPE